MNIDEHLLTCLVEECAEIQKRATKALRFGLDDRDPTYDGAKTERERLDAEVHDFLAVVEMLGAREVLPARVDRERIEEKKRKILQFADYARERGTLE
jgi:hypothetical protein